jgi:hypothetical protein
MSGEKWGIAVNIVGAWGKKVDISWWKESNQEMMHVVKRGVLLYIEACDGKQHVSWRI